MHEYLIDVLFLAPLLLTLLGLSVAVMLDGATRDTQRRMLLLILLVEFLLVVQNCADYLMELLRSASYARIAVSIIGYALRPLMFVLFFRLVAPDKRFWPAWVLIGLNAAVYLTALFSRAAFYFDENSTFHRGPLGFTCFYISALLFVYLIYLTVRVSRKGRMSVFWLPLLSDLFIAAAVVFDVTSVFRAQPISAFTIALVCGSVLYYIGENVWIGAGTIITAGVRIGKNSVIGAGSVVTRSIPENVLALGSPCHDIREIGAHDREFFYYQHDERIDWDNLTEIVEKKRNHPKFL